MMKLDIIDYTKEEDTLYCRNETYLHFQMRGCLELFRFQPVHITESKLHNIL